MTGKTISSTITHTVTLGSGGYVSPLTITTAGTIFASNYYGARGLYLPQSPGFATIVNHGGIFGTYGFYNSQGGNGGIAVELASAATLSNSGSIGGGLGGLGGNGGGNGGIGIDVLAAATLSNTGQVSGGAGGYGRATPGLGGIGISLATSATLNNAGTVTGGNGGASGQQASYDAVGGSGVAGDTEALVVNSGKIFGGVGGFSGSAGTLRDSAPGGIGVYLGAGSTLTNSGTVEGGLGGVTNSSIYYGAAGGRGASVIGTTVTNTGLIRGGDGGYGHNQGFYGGVGLYAGGYSTVTNKGSIAGGNGAHGNILSDQGGNGLVISAYTTATNTGHITGGAGAAQTVSYAFAGAGGYGAAVQGGKLVNNGTIFGGAGGSAAGVQPQGGTTQPQNFAGNGGFGVEQSNGLYGYATSVVNYGLIHGGDGGAITGAGGTAGAGGTGLLLSTGAVTNHGTIIGGAGGYAMQGSFNYGFGGTAGYGVGVFAGTDLINVGSIRGGTGGSNVYTGYQGGAGVLIEGGTFTDSGAVHGGYGGVTQGRGALGDAVDLRGSIAGTLVLNPGASFTGLVTATATVGNVLEVAGTSSTFLGGVGTEFTGFQNISFATGAQRIIEGTVAAFDKISNGALHEIYGFAPHDGIVLDNFTTVLKQAYVAADNIFVITSSGSYGFIELSNSSAKDIIISDGNGKTTISAAVGTLAHTLNSTSEQFVLSGGISTFTTINTGGLEEVSNGGTATSTTIAGGILALQVGAKITGGVTFSATKGGDLIIDSVKMPTATISGFIAGDTIALAGVAYNSNDTVTVASAGLVTIKAPGNSYSLNIAGAKVGETDFKFGTGSLLTRTTAPAMAFLSPRDALYAPGSTAPADAPANVAGNQYAAPLPWQALSPAPVPLLPHTLSVGYAAANLSHQVNLDILSVAHHGIGVG